ncbi:MAG: hypothetical protein H0X42_02720 [Solirubrobacterales bacterium]|nr:hypothetical protein [Solirubrobacterales bacterium]
MLLTALVAPAHGEVERKRDLIVSFGGSISPPLLPRSGRAGVTVGVDARVRTADGRLPPALQRITLDINANGVLTHAGLPSCPIARLQPISTQDALRACGEALVGRGEAGGAILLPEQKPIPFEGRVVAFNGTLANGRRAILAHLYTTTPFPLTFVLPFTIQRTAGTFGTRLVGLVPKNIRERTHVTRLSLRLGRSYEVGGRGRSYLSAGCPAPKGFTTATFPLLRASYGFDDGTTLSSVLIRTCHTR